MLENLKKEVFKANQLLQKYNLVTFTWGNASGFNKETGLIAIKPSGVEYSKMCADDMVIIDLNCNIIEGKMRPSSDAPTHTEIYKTFPETGGIVHTHSKWATVYAQAKRAIKAYGTTHADYFHGNIPVTRDMTEQEIKTEYEKNTGKVIIETLNKTYCPAVLVSSHAPFTFGKTPVDAAEISAVLETVAEMAFLTELLAGASSFKAMDNILLNKHYLRKHGENAYYGQV